MKDAQKTIIEIKGQKFEVDLREATRIQSFKVGDAVKLLVKEGYGDKFVSRLGVIVGFDNFEKHPTIIVASIVVNYNEAKIEFAYISEANAKEEVELCPLNEWDLPFTKQEILDRMDREIARAEEEARELKSKRQYFLGMFGKYFEQHPAIIGDDKPF